MIARAWNPRLHIVHAIEDESISDVPALERWIQGTGLAEGVEMRLHVERGQPAKLVRRIAEESRADLVIIGRSTPGPLGRLRTNSYAIVRESPCPVLSV